MQNKTLNELTKEYLNDCKDIAIEAYALPEDERSDFIHESVDGHQWVIYTYKARLVSVLSENPDAYIDAMGEGTFCTPEQIAYFAMIEDVNTWLNNSYFIEEQDELKEKAGA